MRAFNAIVVSVLALGASTNAALVPAHSAGNASWPYHTFKTAPFNPPLVNVTHRISYENCTKKENGGFLFIAPDGPKPFETAPMIVDMHTGELVWNGPKQHAFSFGVQKYGGQEVLVGWNGTVQPEPVGRGYGEVIMWNRYYEVIHRTTLPGNFLTTVPGHQTAFPSNIDLHEIYITERGTVLVTANNVSQTDLSSVGGPKDGWVVTALVYEIDVVTNQVLFEWNSIDHLDAIPLTASIYPLGSEGYTGTNVSTAWGYFHINSVAPYEDGYIISARYLCSAIALGADGKVKWRIAGGRAREGDFTVDPEARFCYQHDIRPVVARQHQGQYGSQQKLQLHMHDNANCPIDVGHTPTAGKVLDVDLHKRHVSLARQYRNESGPIFATAQGNLQLLQSTENIFVGHGWIPVAEEFSSSGEILSTVQYGAALSRAGGGYNSEPPSNVTLSYRTFKHDWIGCPKTVPEVLAEKVGEKVYVYVSWNGATEVEAWEIFAGMSEGALMSVKVAPKDGFETVSEINSGARYVQILPLMRKAKRGSLRCDARSSIIVPVD